MVSLTKEQVRAVLTAVAYPDIEQAMPVILPPPLTQQFAAHIIDAVEGRKVFHPESVSWERMEGAQPPISTSRGEE